MLEKRRRKSAFLCGQTPRRASLRGDCLGLC